MAYDRTLKHFVSAFELAPIWQSGTVYALNQLVVYNQRLYSCALAHTASGSFETDRAAGDWLEVSSGTTVWASGTYYELNQFVEESNQLYQCIVAHTAGTFATDLTAGKWVGLLPGQTVPISLGGTGQTTQTAAFDALAPTTTAGDIIVHNGTDNVRQGIGTDGQVLVVDSAQTNKLKWATIQQGSKNYIPNSTFENGVTPPSSWSTFNVTIDATTKVPSGAITSPDATYTLATSSSSALAGAYSMTATTGGTVTITTTGRGFISDAFTIDREDQAKPMQFSFYYEAVSGAINFSGTSSNTFAVYVYDVTNSTWIQPAGVYNMTQGSGVGLASGTFQTSATGTQYRLAVIMISSVAGALSIKLDDFRLGPQTVVYGSPVTDWVGYTPTIISGAGTIVSTINGKWRRVGDSAEISLSYVYSSGTGTASVFAISVPFSIDSTKMNDVYGSGYYYSSAVGFKNTDVRFDSVTSIKFTKDSATQFVIGTEADDAGTVITVSFKIPVQGWSSSVEMSNDTDTRVVAADLKSSALQTIPVSTYVPLAVSVVTDTHGAFIAGTGYNSATGVWGTLNNTRPRYVVPVSGYYTITGAISYTNVASGLGYAALFVDNVNFNLVVAVPLNGTYGVRTPFSFGPKYFNAGTVLDVRAYSQTATIVSQNDGSFVNYQRVSGPATIAASETVAFRADGSTTSPTTDTTLAWTNKTYDTHNAFNLNGTFTAPISGKYSFSVSARSAAAVLASTANNGLLLKYQVNSSTAETINNIVFQQTVSSVRWMLFGTVEVSLNANDTFKFLINKDASIAATSLNSESWIVGHKIG